jgi:hypothetical protein
VAMDMWDTEGWASVVGTEAFAFFPCACIVQAPLGPL